MLDEKQKEASEKRRRKYLKKYMRLTRYSIKELERALFLKKRRLSRKA